MARPLLVACLACLAGAACRKKDASPDAVVAEKGPPSSPAAAAPPPPDAAPGPDLDGDGRPEALAISAKTLQINGVFLEHQVEGAEPLVPRIVDVDTRDKRKEVLISACVPEGEDDCGHYFFSFERGKITPSKRIPDTDTDVEIPGDRTLEISGQNCGQTTTVRYVWKKQAFQKKRVKKTGKFDESQCAACPFVYLEGASGRVLAGEILRELRSADAERLQRLRLPRAHVREGRLRLWLVEAKRERTFLDAVFLRIEGRDLRPLPCGGPAGAPFCERDDRYQTLSRGDELELVFAVDDARADAPVELWAEGYYVPSP